MLLFRKYLPVILIVVVSFVAYINSFNCSFHYDDISIITEGQIIKFPGKFLDKNLWMNPNYRAVSLATFGVDYYFWKLNVVGYHISSLLFHIITSILVYFLCRKVLLKSTRLEPGIIQDISLWAAVIYAVHPIQTQAVVYIVQRMSILSAMFFVAAVLAYIDFREYDRHKGILRRLSSLLIFGVCSYLALFSKQNAVTIPLVLIGIELFIIRNKFNKINRVLLVFYASTLVSIIIYYPWLN